jgi:hypothetical protein
MSYLYDKVNKFMSCRYRVLAQVSDSTADVEFVMIGKQAENVIGIRVEALLVEDNPNEDLAPPSIRAIIGKKMLFTVTFNQVSIDHDLKNFTVRKVEPMPADAQLPPPRLTIPILPPATIPVLPITPPAATPSVPPIEPTPAKQSSGMKDIKGKGIVGAGTALKR